MSLPKWSFDSRYPSIDALRERAKQKIPKFAFEYLDGGCNEDVNLHRNRTDIQKVELIPRYLSKYSDSDLSTTLFGETYDAPFGIAPVGLQGLMWPGAPKILAKAAFEHNIPFVLSTVTTESIETIAEITEGKAWFQLYHPAEKEIRNDVIKRVGDAGMPVLVILSDVPTFGFRPRDIKNGLAMPPSMSISNFIQIAKKPDWALRTLFYGQPNFETMKKYMPKGLNLKQLGKYMDDTFSGRLDEDRISQIRDMWKGKLVLKGVASEEDAETSVKLGLDGIIVSNHGGRQLDAGQSSIVPMTSISQKYKDKITVMMDSGIRTGPDVARSIASGADFTFMGRSFMYGVAALGSKGGDHTISMIKAQFQQVMEQLCCERVEDLPGHLVR